MGEAKNRMMRIGEDTITGMARRGFEQFRDFEMKVGARMKEWDHLPIVVKANWKDIIGKALGTKGTLVNCNPLNHDPHTLLITGLTPEQAQGIRAGLEAKLGGTAEKPALNYTDKAWETSSGEDAVVVDNAVHPDMPPTEGSS